MNLESQVCSLELSKRLKELGVNMPPLFYWVRLKDKGDFVVNYIHEFHEMCDDFTPDAFDYYSALTVAELGEMLPGRIIIDSCNYFFGMDCAHGIYYESISLDKKIYISDDNDNEADSRAKMLIWLIESGHVKVGAVTEQSSASDNAQQNEQ